MSVQVSGARPVDRTANTTRRAWWRATSILLLCALLLVRTVPAGAPAYALSSLGISGPLPFPCATPTVFNASGSPTRLFAQTHRGAGSTFAPVGGASGVQYNAVGFNPSDGLIYAVSGPGGTLPPGHLVVVDRAGAVFDRGAIRGIPGLDLERGLNAGSFDDAGRFWVAAGGSIGSGLLYRIDLATRAATPLGGQTAPVRALDFTFAAGFLWGAGSARTVVRVDLLTGRVATFGVPALPAGQFPAAWTGADGHLGFDSTSGSVVELTVSQPGAPVPTFRLAATRPGIVSSANDGTSCTPPPVDLAIAITGPTRRTPGSPITWTLTVQNRGPHASSGFTVSVPVPAGYADVSSTTPGCSVTGPELQCLGAPLATGARAVITLKASAPRRDGCLTTTASVVGVEQDPMPLNNTSSLRTCVRAPAGLTLVQTASTGTGRHADGLARVGETVTFSFVVTNHDEDPVYAVAVLGRLAGRGAPTFAVTCPHRPLLPAHSMRCTASHVVTQADVEAAPLTSTASATGLSTPGSPVVSNVATVTVPTFLTVGLSLVRHVTMLVDRNHNGLADPGDRVRWTFVATNTGTLTLHGVAVNDGQLLAAGIVVRCPRSTLAPAESMSCTSTPHTVTEADVAAGLFGDTGPGLSSPAGNPQPGSPSGEISGAASTDSGATFGPEVVLAFTGVSGGIGPMVGLGLALVLWGALLVVGGRRARRR